MKMNASRWLKITKRVFYNPNVKEDIKIAVLSDLHMSKKVSLLKLDFLCAQLKEQNPDYICLLGDLVDQPSYLEDKVVGQYLFDFLKNMSLIAPVFFVLGNHDLWGKDKHVIYNEAYWEKVKKIPNVHLLNNEIYQNNKIFIMGCLQDFSYYEEYMVKKPTFNQFYKFLKKNPQLYQNLPDSVPKIGLFHSPEFYQDKRIVDLLKNYDLLLGGHTHAGCMPAILEFLPGNFGIISPDSKILPKVVRGMYLLHTKTKLIITGGITKIQEIAPKFFYPFNCLCYQHMDVIIFSSKNKDNVCIENVKKEYLEK